MTDQITVVGNVANDPALATTGSGFRVLRFRVASTRRRFDREKDQWVEDAPNWFSVQAFRSLAVNAAASLRKGQRVVVAGRLRVREWTGENGSRGTEVEILADALGPDLLFGTAAFQRATPSSEPGSSGASGGAPAGGGPRETGPDPRRASAGGHDDVWAPAEGRSSVPGSDDAAAGGTDVWRVPVGEEETVPF